MYINLQLQLGITAPWKLNPDFPPVHTTMYYSNLPRKDGHTKLVKGATQTMECYRNFPTSMYV